MKKFAIFVDSGANIPNDIRIAREIHVISFQYMIDGVEHPCFTEDMPFEETAKQFYDAMRAGAEAKTSLLSAEVFEEALRPALEEGRDVLLFTISSGVSGTFAQAQEAAAQAAQAVGKLEQTALAAKESLGRLRKLEEKGKKLEEEYGRTNRLAALLSGKNACKVPLHQFVLGVMLDDILSSANQFFATLSSGRYSLSRVVGATSGNALGGLDLEVIDAYTGGARAVETLSGGELFLASLSLAFGLSDVVQSYSGGVHLDSLFIDEGFGSLDEEALRQALRVLSSLGEGDKLVGVISHVSELKQNIERQIAVTRTPRGDSTARVILP